MFGAGRFARCDAAININKKYTVGAAGLRRRHARRGAATNCDAGLQSRIIGPAGGPTFENPRERLGSKRPTAAW